MSEPAAVEVSLRELTRANWKECIRLKTLPEQEPFVASNVYSLAEARIVTDYVPLAVYAGEQMVGFVMYIPWDRETGRCWIDRLMIAAGFQGHGYGRRAMELVLERLRQHPDIHEVYLGYLPENTVAAKMYASFGFVLNGEKDGVEDIAVLRFP